MLKLNGISGSRRLYFAEVADRAAEMASLSWILAHSHACRRSHFRGHASDQGCVCYGYAKSLELDEGDQLGSASRAVIQAKQLLARGHSRSRTFAYTSKRLSDDAPPCRL